MIERDGALSLSRQCAVLGVSRSSQYYRPKGESAEDLALMRRMDGLHTAYPFYGSRQLMRHLRREGVAAGRHRIRRLMRLMGMEATYRRPRTSVASPEHRVFPYLLRGLTISRADHVWCADITYVPVTQGFFYLVAVMDWATRHVLAWRLSNTMDASFCVQALDDALGWRAPEILNTDQGSQFTSEAFADRVLGAGGRFSMDGRGRFLDNIFIERLWRSLKYEAVYLYELRDGPDAGRCLPQRHGGSVSAAPSQVPGHALVNRRGREEAQDLSFRCASLRPQTSPGRRSGGSPPGDPGLSWRLCFPSTPRTSGWRICHERTHSECFRGLSRPVGIHLTYGVELSSEVGLPDSDLWHGGKYIESAINYRTPNRASGSM